MRDKRWVLKLDDYEHRLLLRALSDLRNTQIQLEQPTEPIDDLIVRASEAPIQRVKQPVHVR